MVALGLEIDAAVAVGVVVVGLDFACGERTVVPCGTEATEPFVPLMLERRVALAHFIFEVLLG